MARRIPAILCWFLWLLPQGCVEQLTLDGRMCPCVGGWRCCPNDGRCYPLSEDCPGAHPCTEGCFDNQWCYASFCVLCADNKHCGLGCEDCTAAPQDWACLEEGCGCRVDADCPAPAFCQGDRCMEIAADGGTDAGTGDGGADAGVDGGGGGSNNKCCGQSCLDCTRQASDWACLSDHCGCRDRADCLPDQTCQEGRCQASADGGTDGGSD